MQQFRWCHGIARCDEEWKLPRLKSTIRALGSSNRIRDRDHGILQVGGLGSGTEGSRLCHVYFTKKRRIWMNTFATFRGAEGISAYQLRSDPNITLSHETDDDDNVWNRNINIAKLKRKTCYLTNKRLLTPPQLVLLWPTFVFQVDDIFFIKAKLLQKRKISTLSCTERIIIKIRFFDADEKHV